LFEAKQANQAAASIVSCSAHRVDLPICPRIKRTRQVNVPLEEDYYGYRG
jgi:hypothetical protein